MFAREDAWVLDNTNGLGGLNYPKFLGPLGIPEGKFEFNLEQPLSSAALLL